MKCILFLVLVGSHLLVDAKALHARACETYPSPASDCRATITSVVQTSGTLVVSLVPHKEEADCIGATDTLEYNFQNDPELHQIPIAGTVAVIPGFENICTNLIFRISTDDVNGDILCYEYTHNTEPSPIEDLKFEQLDADNIQLTWDQKDTDCAADLTFEVKFGGTVDQSCTQQPCTIDVTAVDVCDSKEVSVIASLTNGGESPEVKATYTKPLSSVTVEGRPNPDGGVFASFTPLAITGSCDNVNYELKQVDTSCYNSEFTVQVVADSPDGNTVTIPSEPVTFVRGPERVINPTYQLVGANIKLAWISPYTPIEDEDCYLWYTIEYSESTVTTHLTSLEIENRATACKAADVTINANVGTTLGKATVIPILGQIGGVKSLDCTITAQTVTCTWAEPDNVDLCDVKYKIIYNDGEKETPLQNPIPEKSYTFTASCADNTDIYIRVTPIVNLDNGETREGVPLDKLVGCSRIMASTWWKHV